jgi:outer membrane protein TolC
MMKNLRHTIILIFFLRSVLSSAQNLTLEQALSLGLQNSDAIRLEKEKNVLNDFDESVLKASMKPQISFGADLRANLKLQESVLPFSFGPNGIEEGETVVPFGRRFNNSFTIEAQQKILDFSTKYDKELINIKRSSSTIFEKEKTDELKNKINESYYNLIFRNERLFVESAISEVNKEVATLVSDKLSTGVVTENDYLKAKLDLKESERILKQELVNQKKAKDNLNFLIGNDQFATDSISIDDLISPELPNLIANKGIEMLKEENFITELEVKIRRENALKLPSISAYGNLTAFQQANTFNPFENNSWFQFSFVGVRLNWTLFDGKSNQIKQDKFQFEKKLAQKKIQILQNERNQEIKEIYTELSKDKDNLNQLDESIQLAKAILETDLKNFGLGATPYLDVLDSKKRLANLQLTRLEFVYNFLNNHYKWENLTQ